MVAKHVEPAIDLESFSCPHCGALAQQTWIRLYGKEIADNGTPFQPDGEFVQKEMGRAERQQTEQRRDTIALVRFAQRVMAGELFFEELLGEYGKLPLLANVHVSLCFACRGHTIWVRDGYVFPIPPDVVIEPNEDMNDDIKADFKEAATILTASPRGAAALLRLCVQKLCKQLGEPGDNINTDIGSLVKKKGLDVRVQQALDIVRVVGNETVHPGQIDLRDNRQTATELFDLVNIIADTMISQPRRIAKMYSTLPPEKLKGIADRDKKS
jgi:hypothetical protein